jgi:hypothetical protein
MGQALRRDAHARRGWWITLAVARHCLIAGLVLASPLLAQPNAPVRFDRDRFTVIGFPNDEQLMRSLLDAAVQRDSFPWLPPPRASVVIAVAPDERRFREWIGAAAPEWGAAIAFPAQRMIIMQGRTAGSDAGDPLIVLRHELAHLALEEALGDLAPRWFHEGYASVAAGEWGRDEVLATSVALLVRGMPSLDSLDASFNGSARRADAAYALAHRAVVELAALDPERGLTLFFEYWRESRSLEVAMRRAFGLTQAQFDERWRQRTRRQYGALAIAADLSLAAALLMTIVAPLYMARRGRDRRRLEAMRAADAAAERAAQQSALAALLEGPQGAQGAQGPQGANGNNPRAP